MESGRQKPAGISGSLTTSSLTCTGCVGNTQLGVNYAGSATQGGPATSALTAAQATNALALGGVTATNYARLDIGNSFTGNQSVTGNLNVSGNSATAGTVTMGSGGTPVTQHVSILANPSFAALKPSACVTASFTLTGAADGDTIALGVPNARIGGGGILNYFAWVSAASTVTLRACNLDPNNPQKTAGSGAIRIDLWKR